MLSLNSQLVGFRKLASNMSFVCRVLSVIFVVNRVGCLIKEKCQLVYTFITAASRGRSIEWSGFTPLNYHLKLILFHAVVILSISLNRNLAINHFCRNYLFCLNICNKYSSKSLWCGFSLARESRRRMLFAKCLYSSIFSLLLHFTINKFCMI